MANKVGQGDKALLVMESPVNFDLEMLEELVTESFLECATKPYFDDVYKVQWSASDDVSMLFQDDDEYDAENSNYSSVAPFDASPSSISSSPPCKDYTHVSPEP